MKNLTVTTVTVVALVALMAISAGSKNPNPYDVNQDGEVNWTDVFAVYGEFVFHKDAPDLRADVNDDGEVTGEDVKAVYAALPIPIRENFPGQEYYYFVVTAGHLWRDTNDDWRVEPVDKARVDFNADIVVDIIDLVIWGQRYDMEVTTTQEDPFLLLVDVYPDKLINEEDGIRVSDWITSRPQVPEMYLYLKYKYKSSQAPPEDIPDIREIIFGNGKKLKLPSSWGRMKNS